LISIHIFQYDIVEPERGGHPLPLFVHANLLKHLGGMVPAGTASAFTIIKRATDDVANARSLDAVRAYVYNTHGMCTDMEVYEDELKEGKGGGAGGQTVIEENFETAYEGRFAKWYEQVYAKHGGKKGGW
jgi:alpha 1,2-mannosyltransferase